MSSPRNYQGCNQPSPTEPIRPSLTSVRWHSFNSQYREESGGNRYTTGAITVNSFVPELDTYLQRAKADSADDAMLVAGARSGDSSAFVELSKRHSRRVLHKIYRITRNWQDAEDVLQDSLMRAFVHLDTFEYKASFSTWFTSIAMNTALMLLRKQRRFTRIAIDSAVDDRTEFDKWEFRDHRGDPEQYYARQQGAELLRRAILRLSPGCRRVVELQQAGELSTKEIAESLGISQAAVKSRLFHARSVLRALVQKRIRRSYTCSGPRSNNRSSVSGNTLRRHP
jgi:RNA polymerase sigma-70 factor, ECF subfamily